MSTKKPAPSASTGGRGKSENCQRPHHSNVWGFRQLWGWYCDGSLGANDPQARRLSSIAERRRYPNGIRDEVGELRAELAQVRREISDRPRSECDDESPPMSRPTVEVPKGVRRNLKRRGRRG